MTSDLLVESEIATIVEDPNTIPMSVWLMTHKCRGSIVVLSISKSVEPNKEQKEMISSFH